MKEIKQEVIHKSYKTVYEANDGTQFDSKEECLKYEQSAVGVLMVEFKELQVNFITEYELFDTGSEEYFYSIVKLEDKDDIELVMRLYYLLGTKTEEHVARAKAMCLKALDEDDYLIIGRGCEYDNFDGFWMYGTLKERLNRILKCCDKTASIAIIDDLTPNDEMTDK